jgi:lipopolysaccharide transport system ATP-binding protein
VSFDVARGEAVGLIGRNGAGKSTLLKLLSRVTPPTSGYADIYGRVGALIEVGTGFHPELTGRENAFLSGAILGMSRRDVTDRFDDIVAFAEIDRFVDTPVKWYSSGMYARLGFAVAAFLRPAILIVDEVLAVGDLAFQAKCLAQMTRLSADGTTVLFVSHNMLAISDFCSRSLVMADGRLAFDGATPDAIALYRRLPPSVESRVAGSGDRPNHRLVLNGQEAVAAFESGTNDPLSAQLIVDLPEVTRPFEVELNLVVESSDGRMVIHLRNDVSGTTLTFGPGRTVLRVDVDDPALAAGAYRLWLRVVALHRHPPLIWDTDRVEWTVRGDSRIQAVVQPRHRFSSSAEPD